MTMTTATEALEQATTQLAARLQRKGMLPEKATEVANYYRSRLTVSGDDVVRVLHRGGRGTYPGDWETQLNLLAAEAFEGAPREFKGGTMTEEEQDRMAAQKHQNVGYSF